MLQRGSQSVNSLGRPHTWIRTKDWWKLSAGRVFIGEKGPTQVTLAAELSFPLWIMAITVDKLFQMASSLSFFMDVLQTTCNCSSCSFVLGGGLIYCFFKTGFIMYIIHN